MDSLLWFIMKICKELYILITYNEDTFYRTKTARIGLCLPRDATIIVKFLNLSAQKTVWVKGTSVDSLDKLESSTTFTDYFLDSEVG